jgi:hypothetical protein
VFENAARPAAEVGRTPAGVSVAALAKSLMDDKRAAAVRIDLREGENGMVSARVWARRVWVQSPDRGELEEEWLIIRHMPDGTIKYTLSNAPARTSVRQLAKWSASRFYVERTFQDAKSHAGMGDYQCRGWKAWHHHMAMVCLATLFLMEERMFNPMGMPLLSAHDIVELLDWAFRKHRSASEMIEYIAKRHDQRARNAATARLRKRRELASKSAKKKLVSLPK